MINSEDFQIATEESPRFFGNEWKNVSRNWSNYLCDLTEDLKICENESETQTLHILISKASAARRVLGPINLSGFRSLKVVDAYDKEVNWLQQQDPPVDNPFSVSVKGRSLRHGL